MNVRRLGIAALLLAALAGAAPADLRDSQARLDATEAEARATRTAIDLITARIERNEGAAAELQQRILYLDEVRRGQLTTLAGRQDEVMRLLAALQTLSRRPPALLLAQPQGAVDAARVSLLLETMTPQLRLRTRALRQQIERAAETRRRLATERAKLGTVQAALAADIRRLQGEGTALAARAQTLRELVDGLTRHTERVLPQLDLLRPVEGSLVSRFGAPNAVGVPSQGLSWRTAPNALVMAPADGRVAFTGPFGTYGRIVILEHDGGVLSLLSGMGGARVTAGQRVRGGGIVGLMGTREPTLYLEVRAAGTPVDPQRWLRRTSGG
ncbi:murein hydrolase activator EnvC family protein [Sphingoaurantiacus capsulatus]|uniref:Murein hydrolase activator EnvC family protein n=1 Tax=Sphingoaurantiacus capsulatus TaxID=1771310 RepID=A0ABV7X9W3_9SPHN